MGITKNSNSYIFRKWWLLLEINTSKLSIEITNLKTALSEYEENNLNYYNELNSIPSYWEDNHETLFLDTVSNQKNSINTFIEEIQNIIDIYSYLLEQYQNLGTKLSFDLTKKDSCIQSFDNYLTKLEEILNLYNNLNLTSFPYRNTILKQKRTIKDMKTTILNIKEQYKKITNKIEEIEQTASNKISKVSLQEIEEINVNNYI